MGRACSTYRGEERFMQCLVGKPEGRNYLEDEGIDGEDNGFSRSELGLLTGSSLLRIKTEGWLV
jgi:hypothetical protein